VTTRAEVVAEARRWLRTPFQHQARLRDVAVDCAGLVIGVARALGIVAPDFEVTGYPRSPDGRSMLELCDRFMRRIDVAAMQAGDVFVIRWAKDPQHLAIATDYPHGGLAMLHAYGTPDGRGEVIEHRIAPHHRRLIVQAYALPGLT
jgi:NlpC/P60 family putative phage cell wall peptidase